jgi:hypothetical protein
MELSQGLVAYFVEEELSCRMLWNFDGLISGIILHHLLERKNRKLCCYKTHVHVLGLKTNYLLPHSDCLLRFLAKDSIPR